LAKEHSDEVGFYLGQLRKNSTLSYYLRKYPQLGIKEIERQAEREIRRNIEAYGVPFLWGIFEQIERDKLVEKLKEVMDEYVKSNPVEIHIYPEDEEGRHFSLHHNIMRWDDDKGFLNANDYERKRFYDELKKKQRQKELRKKRNESCSCLEEIL